MAKSPLESRLNLVTKKTEVGIVSVMIDFFFLTRLIDSDWLGVKNFSGTKKLMCVSWRDKAVYSSAVAFLLMILVVLKNDSQIDRSKKLFNWYGHQVFDDIMCRLIFLI